MKEKYFKCTLITDIVLNASLATEGNMATLDYIPGSNFLGIVAAEIYNDKTINVQQKNDLLHSDNVSFGDAIISENNKLHYPMPFMYFKDKLNKKGDVYLHHKIDQKEGVVINGKKLQLKQERSGFLNIDGKVIENINKTFALKSAQNRETRTSKEGAMFGFESIKANQEFIFSIKYNSDYEIEIVEKLLRGKKRIGKSKSAEFGQVDIQPLTLNPSKIDTFQENDFTLVYAESNLCFIDKETGQSTYKPSAEQLGIEGGTIDWNKSSIRTNSYSPWNFKRNTSNMQRNCILKGSVFYVEKGIKNTDNKSIGEFTAEGMGRVINNPIFLKTKSDGVLDFKILEKDNPENKKEVQPIEENCKTDLGKILYSKYNAQKLDLDIARQVVDAVKNSDWDLKSNITSSQWGNIRALATNYIKNGKKFDDLYTKIGFCNEETLKVEREKIEKEGIITHGKMSEKLWNKNRKENFKQIIKNTNLVFVAKYAAEMAKVYIDIKNGKIKKAI
jgi:hypothetical protein